MYMNKNSNVIIHLVVINKLELRYYKVHKSTD